ncbi:MAG: ribosome-binding factor A [Candidatus Komeilibacteria bacterium]
MSERTNKLNALVQQNLNLIFIQDVEWPRDTMATITRVEVTPDLSWAFVTLSILPINKQGTVLKKLTSQLRDIQHKLNKTLQIRKAPKIKFKIDSTELESRKIDRELAKN